MLAEAGRLTGLLPTHRRLRRETRRGTTMTGPPDPSGGDPRRAARSTSPTTSPRRRARKRSARSRRPATASPASAACLAMADVAGVQDGTLGIALNLDNREIGVVVLGDFDKIEEGQTVRRTARSSRFPSATPSWVASSTRSAPRSTASATSSPRDGALASRRRPSCSASR